MVMHTLPADLLRNPVFHLVPLKGARNAGEGRLVSLAPATARALAVYLRARRSHKLADSEWVWLGTRNRGRLGNTGIRKMLVRRAAEAGYAQVTPHQFRHTFSDGWQMGRIASDATFPGKRDRGGVWVRDRALPSLLARRPRDTPAPSAFLTAGCSGCQDVAPDSVALGDRAMHLT